MPSWLQGRGERYKLRDRQRTTIKADQRYTPRMHEPRQSRE
jgi:hypothetical protein